MFDRAETYRTRAALTRTAIETMLAFTLRTPRVFTEARSKLKPEYFDAATEGHLRLIWEAALKVAAHQGGMLPCASPNLHLLLETEVQHLAAAQPDTVNPAVLAQAVGPGSFLEWCLNSVAGTDQAAADREPSAFVYLNQFIVERGPLRDLQASLAGGAGAVPEHLPQILEAALTEVRRSAVLAENPVESAAPADWTPEAVQRRTTGVEFLDRTMRGGHADGEVYLLLGGTGVGKSTLARKICVEGARGEQKLAAQRGRPPRHWYLFTYEGGAGHARLLLWCYAAQIHWDSLENFDWGRLSRGDARKLYEVQRFGHLRRVGEPDPGSETERLQKALAELAANVQIIDMTGAGQDPMRGTGLAEEVRDILQRDQDAEGRQIGGVVLDWAGLAVDRHIYARGLKIDAVEHHLLASFPYDCRRLIADHFRCPVWVVHQLNAEANRKAPTSIPHHAWASECGLFAVGADFVWCLGTKDRQTSTCVATCSKTRWSGGEPEPVVIFIDGAYADMVEANDFVLDRARHRIVNRTTAASVAVPSASTKKHGRGERRGRAQR